MDQANVPGWDLVQEMMSPLFEKELNTFAGLLEIIRKKAFEYLNPGETMKEVEIDDIEKVARFLERTGKAST